MSLKSELQDSQDWLNEILDTENDKYWDSVAHSYYGGYGGYDPKVAEIKSAMREHFLKEALEMFDSMPKLILKGEIEDDMGLFGDYIELAELRNKFNDKYKED